MKMPGGKRRAEKGKVGEVNMTPMIDIVFNLIIFFILTPSFKATEGYLPTNLPNEGQGTTTTDTPQGYRIELTALDEKGGVSIGLNGRQVRDFAHLRSSLEAAAKELSDEQRLKLTVVISPSTATWHRHVVAAFDAAIAAKLPSIAFTVPK